MFELFQTWKNPPVNCNTPYLFAIEQMNKLENFLIRARQFQGSGRKPSPGPNSPLTLQQHAQDFISRERHGLPQHDLLTAVDQLVELTNQRKAMNPGDIDAHTQIDMLHKLKDVLSTQSLPPSILPAIQDKLMAFTRKELERLNSKTNGQNNHHYPPPSMLNQPVQNQPNFGYSSNFNNNIHNNHNGNQLQQQQQQDQPNQHQAQQQYQQLDLSKLGTLVQQMVGGPQQVQQHQQQQNHHHHQQQQQLQQNQLQQPGALFGSSPNPILPESLINSLKSAGLINNLKNNNGINGIAFKVELTNADIVKPRSDFVEFLYKKLPNQCSTCGKRYSNDTKGQEEREKHLDWHFRVNKRLREENRAVNRCWYLTEREWIEYHDEDEILGLVQVEQEKLEKDSQIDIEALSKKFVAVPIDKTISNLCPICKDKFETQWSEEAEDWVWINTIEEKGKYFHAICHAEAQLAKKKDSKEKERKAISNSKDLKDSVRNSPTPSSMTSQAATPVATSQPIETPSQSTSQSKSQPVLHAGIDLASILANAGKRKFEGEEDQGTKREKSMV